MAESILSPSEAARPNAFPEACASLLSALVSTALPDDLRRASEVFSDSLEGGATPALLEGLHVLWPLMRHIEPSDCWTLLSPETKARSDLRPDIRSFLELMSSQPLRNIETLARAQLAPVRQELQALAGALSEVCQGGLDRHFPAVRSYGGAERGLLDHDEARARFQRVFAFLCWPTQHLEKVIGADPTFWGVLGPLADALHFDTPVGFGSRISSGREMVLEHRLTTGRADLLDCWLLFRSPNPTWRSRVEAILLDFAEKTPTPALEAFFEDLWLWEPEGQQLYPPERAFAHADTLWKSVIRRPDASRALLARAGDYFWTEAPLPPSRFPKISALPLAAFAMEELTNPIDCRAAPEILGWAFETAMRASQGDFALDCLNTLLALVAALALHGELTLFALNQLPVRTTSLYVTVAPARDRSLRSPESLLRLTIKVLGDDPMLARSRFVRQLRRVARSLRIPDLEADPRTAIPPDVWERLEKDTQRLLEEAELHWAAVEGGLLGNDYSSIGVTFRRAIEAEWRAKLAVPGVDARQTLGQTVARLLDMGSMWERHIASRFGPQSHLLDRRFLSRLLEVCGDYLNPGAHPEGLSREKCGEMRTIFLDHGLLRQVLAAVQSPARPQADS